MMRNGRSRIFGGGWQKIRFMLKWGTYGCLIGFVVSKGFGADRPSEAVIPEHLNEQALRAVKNGLDYLSNTQQANGSWSNAGAQGYPTAMTALAGMGLLCSGSTPDAGPYAPNLKRAVQYLLECAESGPSGLITSDHDGRSMHGHGFAMLFLAECYGDELDVKTQERIRHALEKAVELTAKSQSHAGGWIYTPDANGDEGSVTVTQLQGLRACRNAGIKVPRSTIDRAVKYLEICQNPDGGISYSAQNLGQSRPAISAAAVATLYAAGQYDSKVAEKCLEYVMSVISPTRSDGHYFYTQLYTAQALYQVHDQRYAKYFPQLRDFLLAQQAADGSWAGDGIGPIYGTAVACIILQLPYDYVPIYQR